MSKLILPPCLATGSSMKKPFLLAILVAFETVGCEFYFHKMVCV